jgi:hypothetical protein
MRDITKAIIDHKVGIAILKFNMEINGGQTTHRQNPEKSEISQPD